MTLTPEVLAEAMFTADGRIGWGVIEPPFRLRWVVYARKILADPAVAAALSPKPDPGADWTVHHDHETGAITIRAGDREVARVADINDALAIAVAIVKARRVKPDHATVLALIHRRLEWASLHWRTEKVSPDAWEAIARSVAANLPGRTEAQVKAEALREAATDLWTDDGTPHPLSTATWLRDRADRITRGES